MLASALNPQLGWGPKWKVEAGMNRLIGICEEQPSGQCSPNETCLGAMPVLLQATTRLFQIEVWL